MTGYISVKEFSKIHDIDGSDIRKMIHSGRIPAEKIGNQWVIPKDTPRPTDLRVKSGKYRNWRTKKPFDTDGL